MNPHTIETARQCASILLICAAMGCILWPIIVWLGVACDVTTPEERAEMERAADD